MCDVIMMSLGLYSNVWQRLIIINSQTVKGILGGVPSLPKPVQIPSFTRSGTTVIELRELKKKKNMDNMTLIFTFGGFFYVLKSVHIICVVCACAWACAYAYASVHVHMYNVHVHVHTC